MSGECDSFLPGDSDGLPTLFGPPLTDQKVTAGKKVEVVQPNIGAFSGRHQWQLTWSTAKATAISLASLLEGYAHSQRLTLKRYAPFGLLWPIPASIARS